MRVRQALSRLGAAFWTIPAVGAVLGVVFGWLAPRIDLRLGGHDGLLFGGGPDSAQAILQTVATSVLTFAGLTFSITVVALQLASSQFSPRVLGPLLRDRWTGSALATFVGTFAYCLMVLREVQSETAEREAFVPGLAVGLALVLALTAISALVGFIQHIAQSLRVVTIIDRTFRDTAAALDAWYGGDQERAGALVEGPRRMVTARRDGVLAWYDRDALVRLAAEQDLSIEVLVPAGSWVVAGRPLLMVHGRTDEDVDADAALGLGHERQVARDPAYGFRLLVDIAERALSPGVNDPTTAVQCLDRIHSLLARLAREDLAVGDTVLDGVVRLRLAVPTWEDYLGLACDEIRHWGMGYLRVHRRLETMLHDLERHVPVEREQAVREQLAALRQVRTEEVHSSWELASTHGDPAEVHELRGPQAR
ncbi:DUF2254 domain-containing protein [Nocardioides panaciterrulae]|uniref:Putative membrane protein n=1 Tax=Nocardioides panaciterrulae TaxID=661492 RepID=A0A7Y9E7B2_9ACTN|nr:DUF2254 domain-containing protein [Nocardioides panaciterrulae]NYD42480.1 putative membrane protein [Nocardioides panaciterrulae]